MNTKKRWLFWTAFFIICLLSVGCNRKPEPFHIGILQWTEKVEPFNQTYRGVIDGLADLGFRDGINMNLSFENARQDNATALTIARIFVDEEVDLIVALGTGSSLSALEATETIPIPIVFSIVGAPKATGIIQSYADSGRNITGVSMKVPVAAQFRMLKECLPQVKNLGVLYCTKMPQAVATGREGMNAAPGFGWTTIDIPVSFSELPTIERRLGPVAERVDAIYIPTDPILGSPENLKRIISVFDAHAIPVITVAERFVEQGSLMALNCDFYEIGRQAAGQVEKVLSGVPVREVAVQKPTLTRLSLNLQKARKLGIDIKRNCILRADKIMD